MSKKIIFLLAIFIGVASFGQKTNNIFDKKEKATIYFRDSTIQKGYAKIIGSVIKYKKDKNSKKQVFDERNVKKIVFEKPGIDLILEYKIVKGTKTPLLLEPIVKGTITLYRDTWMANKWKANGEINNSNISSTYYNSYKITDYYISKNNEIFVEKITSTHPFSKNFKKAASIYFKNCPELVEKIESKEFKKGDIRRVVRYYNTKCYKRPIATENDSLNNKKYSNKLNLRNGKSI